MERFLLLSGRVISFIFVLVGAALLVLMLSGILLVNATSVVPVFGQNLVNDHVIDDLPPALWQSFTEAIPPEVQIGTTTIETQPLVNALGRSLRDIIDSGLPLGEWLQIRAQELIASVTDNLRGRVTTVVGGGADSLQSALSETAAQPVATIVLAALDQCTDAQVSEISRILGTSPSNRLSVGISFLCRPPEDLGVGAVDLMRNAITLVLAEVGRQAASVLETRLAAIELPSLSIDSPIGLLTLEWPDVRIGSGFLSVTVPLPDSIVDPVNEAVGGFIAPIIAPVQQVQEDVATQAVEARETVAAVGSALGTEVATRIPPTATATPVPPTATAVPTLVPTLTPDELLAQRNAVSPLEQRVLNVLNRIGEGLGPAAGQITLVLLLVLGLPLLLHGYLQLYLMRTLRLWGLWIALVTALSGLILLLINNLLVAGLVDPLTPTGSSTLPTPLAAVWDGALLALQNALQTELNTPFTVVGLLLLVVGLVGIVVLGFQIWRGRRLGAV
ncbi:MAG TPA: hypothetical protein VER79_04565 [Candidatus Limnocylindrales bacterium]|nr:hypothetical protein [Candidatus Limnocylindrales bacterium]